MLDYPYYPSFWPYKTHQRYCCEFSPTHFSISIPQMVSERLRWTEDAVKFVDIIPSISMEYWHHNSDVGKAERSKDEHHDITLRKEIAFDPSLTILADRRHDHRFISTFSETVDAAYIAILDPDDRNEDPKYLREPVGGEGKTTDTVIRAKKRELVGV